MTATGLKRPAPVFFAGVVLAGMTAALAMGQARAQFVNPVPPTSPTFNPSTPSPPPPLPPVTPVSPTVPGGVSGPGTVPGTQGAVPPITTAPRTTSAPTAATPERSRAHARNDGRARGRHVRSARVRGPSYYPGLGLLYPPYANPCHFRPTWYAYYGDYLSYGCAG